MSVKALAKGGPYEVRWREGNRNRSRRFKLKTDADAWDREVKRRKALGPVALQQMTVRGPTLAEYIVHHWSPDHGESLEQKTRLRYANSYAVHIKPWLGHLSLQDLGVGRLRQWQAERLAAGASAHAIMKARTVLSSVLRHAAEGEFIAANPLSLVRPPRAPHQDDVVPLAPSTVEQLRAVLELRDATLVSVLAYSGIRPGELRSLRWGDIRERINVQRAANPDGTSKGPKSKRGRRPVRLLEPLAVDLAAWRETTNGSGLELVFPRSDGRTMTETDWNNWRDDIWVPLWKNVDLDELELPQRPRPYDLRHSFASLLLAEGRTIHYVAEQLGHDAQLTLSTYGHVVAEWADRTDLDVNEEITKARAAAIAAPTWPKPAAKGQVGRNREKVLDAVAAGHRRTSDIAEAASLNISSTRSHLHRAERDGLVVRESVKSGQIRHDEWTSTQPVYASRTFEGPDAA